MPMSCSLSVAGFIFALVLCNSIKHAKADAEFIYAACSPAKYDTSTPYQSNLNELLSSLISASTASHYDGFAIGNDSSSSQGKAAYGLYQCRNDINLPECSECVKSAVNKLSVVCSNSVSASLQLENCYVRYSSDDFVGRLDTTEQYSKCSKSKGDGDEEFFRKRDDVMTDLEAATATAEGFRVSKSGTVQGYAQCTGDVVQVDCAACVARALTQLKNECAAAMAGDVYLAKCYARYWVTGYYLRSVPDHSDDDIGKTVAIMVGTIAGLIFFVVFLSFIRRAC